MTNPTTPKSTIQRATSRKFLVTLMTLLALYQTPSLDHWTKVIIAVIAAVYVIGETVLDKGGQARILEVARAAIAGPVSGAPSSTAAIVTALANSTLPGDAKELLAQAHQLIEGAAAGLSKTPQGSHPPDTEPSPPMTATTWPPKTTK